MFCGSEQLIYAIVKDGKIGYETGNAIGFAMSPMIDGKDRVPLADAMG